MMVMVIMLVLLVVAIMVVMLVGRGGSSGFLCEYSTLKYLLGIKVFCRLSLSQTF